MSFQNITLHQRVLSNSRDLDALECHDADRSLGNESKPIYLNALVSRFLIFIVYIRVTLESKRVFWRDLLLGIFLFIKKSLSP